MITVSELGPASGYAIAGILLAIATWAIEKYATKEKTTAGKLAYAVAIILVVIWGIIVFSSIVTF